MSSSEAKPAQVTPEAAQAKTAETLYPSTPPQAEGVKAEAAKAAEAKAPEAPKAEEKSESKPAEKKTEVEAKAEPKVEEKKEENKAEPEKPKVPEKYELKLPKDSLMDPARVEKIASFAKERGLSQDQAQAVLERESDAISSYAASQQEALKQKASEWKTAVESDKEIGGPALTESVEFAKRALDKFASPTLKQQLNETGLGNHPELVRAFARIGKAMGDDKLVLPGSRENPSRSFESILYGDSTSRES